MPISFHNRNCSYWVTIMTKKHFEALARAIAAIDDEKSRRDAAIAVMNACALFNPQFDAGRFLVACGVKV